MLIACSCAGVIWYVTWVFITWGWWVAYYRYEFPSLYENDGFDYHKYGFKTPEEEYRIDLVAGFFWALACALLGPVTPLICLISGPLWKHGWQLKRDW